MLAILWSELGFRGIVYKWFEELLSHRRQSVSIDGHRSRLRENTCGVPQGSVVGPWCFNVYVRNLIKLMESYGFIVHGYADDHQFLLTFTIDFQVAVIRDSIPHGMDIISDYMNKHFLKLNPAKSQVIVFCPKMCHNQFVFERLMLSDGTYVKISQEVNNLGVLMDNHLTYSAHISSTISQGYHLIRNVSTIRKYLSIHHLKSLVNSIVISKVDHCNSLFYGITSYNIDRLQKLQNSCARLIYGISRRDHISGVLRELHWLPSDARIYFKILCYVYKCLNNLAPVYLTELINVRRHRDLNLEVRRTTLAIGDRAFSSAGPRL